MQKPRLSFRDEETITHRKRSSPATSEKIFNWENKKGPPITDCFGSNATFLWERLTSGYRIVDLQELTFDNALMIIQDNFFPNEPVCRANMISERIQSVTDYTQYLLDILLQEDSIGAVQEGTGELVGVAVLSICSEFIEDPNDPFDMKSNNKEYKDEVFARMMFLDQYLISKAEIFKNFEIDKYFRINLLCVLPNHQNKGIASALVRSSFAKCWVRQIPLCVGIFTSGASFTIANRLGFQTLKEVTYKDSELLKSKITSIENVHVLVSEEKTAMCMGFKIPSIDSLPAVPIIQKPAKMQRTNR